MPFQASSPPSPQLGEELNLSLGKERVRQAETDAYIVDRLIPVLHALKPCRSEQQRIEYHIILAAVAPEVAVAGPKGWGTRISERLNVSFGWRTRTAKEKAAGAAHGRPRALRRAMSVREMFEEKVAVTFSPLQIGDAVLACGQPGELTGMHEGGRCTITFESDGADGSKTYESMYGNGKGSARLQRPPPSLAPAPRSERSDKLTLKAVNLIQAFWRCRCSLSPHQRDARRRRKAPYVYEHAQGHIQSETDDAIAEEFLREHPDVCKKREFLLHKPWYCIKAYRETCLCKTCENLRLYIQTLNKVVAPMLSALCEPSVEAEEGEEGVGAGEAAAAAEPEVEAEGNEAEENEAAEATPIIKQLADFAALTLKSQVANALVAPCAESLQEASSACVNGTCPHCGFRRWWSGPNGLRRRLFDSNGDIKDDAAAAWQTTIQWERITSASSTPSDGSRGIDEDAMREQREGTLGEFFDELERVTTKVSEHTHAHASAQGKRR